MLPPIDDKTKRDVFIPRFDESAVPPSVKEKIAYHETVGLQLRRDAGMVFDVYLPNDHPLFAYRLLHIGRYYELRDAGASKQSRATVYCDAIERMMQRDMEIAMADRPNLLNGMNYQGELYHRVTFLFIRSQPVANFNAVHADHPVFTQDFNRLDLDATNNY